MDYSQTSKSYAVEQILLRNEKLRARVRKLQEIRSKNRGMSYTEKQDSRALDPNLKVRFESVMKRQLGDNQRTENLLRRISEGERYLRKCNPLGVSSWPVPILKSNTGYPMGEQLRDNSQAYHFKTMARPFRNVNGNAYSTWHEEYFTRKDLVGYRNPLEQAVRSMAMNQNLLMERQNKYVNPSQENRGSVDGQTIIRNASRLHMQTQWTQCEQRIYDQNHFRHDKSWQPGLQVTIKADETIVWPKKSKKRKDQQYLMKKYLQDSVNNQVKDINKGHTETDSSSSLKTEHKPKDKSNKSGKAEIKRIIISTRIDPKIRQTSAPEKVSKATSYDTNILRLIDLKHRKFYTVGTNTSKTGIINDGKVHENRPHKEWSTKNDFQTALCLEENVGNLKKYSQTTGRFSDERNQEESITKDGSSQIIDGVLVKLSRSMNLQANCKKTLEKLKRSKNRTKENDFKTGYGGAKKENVHYGGVFKQGSDETTFSDKTSTDTSESVTYETDSEMLLCSSCEYDEMLMNPMKQSKNNELKPKPISCYRYGGSDSTGEVSSNCTIVVDVGKRHRKQLIYNNEHYEETISEGRSASDETDENVSTYQSTNHGNGKQSRCYQKVGDLRNKSKTMAQLHKEKGPLHGASDASILANMRWYHICLGKIWN